MSPFALTLATLLLSTVPASAQDAETQRLRAEAEKLKADKAALERQLEGFQAQLKELNDKLFGQKKPATGEQQTQEALRLLAELEERKNKARAMAPAPAPAVPDPNDLRRAAARAALEAAREYSALPSTPIEAKVCAVANEIDLVVISSGTEDGVKEGDEFTVFRSGEFVAKVKIDRSDRKWSAGKVVLRKLDPRVGDSVSNHLVVTVPRAVGDAAKGLQYGKPAPMTPGKSVWIAGSSRVPSEEVQSLRKELDEVRAQVRQLSDRLVPSYQGPGVSVEEASEELRAHLGILRGLLVRRVREGSAAEKAGLKANDVIPDLLEAQLIEAIESGMPVHVVRQGGRVRLPGAKGR